MTATASGADILANTLLPSLTQGVDFSVPPVNLTGPEYSLPPATGAIYEPIDSLTSEDLTTGIVGGSGMFDRIMVSLVAHLKVEYNANRIAGAEYTKAYIGVIGAALQTASQYLLAKDQAYWQAILVQQQARVAEIEVVKARVELETAKMMLMRTQFEAHTAEAQYGMTKMQIANADAEYAASVAQTAGVTYTNANMLPAQHTQLLETTKGVVYTNTQLLPAQKVGIDRTNENLKSQGDGIDYTNANILPQQRALLKEQGEVQHAQTSDKRLDGAVVEGAVGKQKDLYDQQITAYKRDSETKLVKMYSDAWLTQKTVDEGYPLPKQFANAEIDEILIALRRNMGTLGT